MITDTGIPPGSPRGRDGPPHPHRPTAAIMASGSERHPGPDRDLILAIPGLSQRTEGFQRRGCKVRRGWSDIRKMQRDVRIVAAVRQMVEDRLDDRTESDERIGFLEARIGAQGATIGLDTLR